MSDEARIQQLLEEILDSNGTPEDVCPECPELLHEVHKRWERLQSVEAQVEALFPTPGLALRAQSTQAVHPDTEPPRIPGYEVQALLGRGGMGVVYKARHLKLNRAVAIKMMLAGAYADRQQLTRFMREAETVAGLRHAHIVQVYDVGNLDGLPVLHHGVCRGREPGTEAGGRAPAGPPVRGAGGHTGWGRAPGPSRRDRAPRSQAREHSPYG